MTWFGTCKRCGMPTYVGPGEIQAPDVCCSCERKREARRRIWAARMEGGFAVIVAIVVGWFIGMVYAGVFTRVVPRVW